MRKSSEMEDSVYADHQVVWESLPWYVNGTLAGPELAQVDRHVQSCVACRAELKYLRELGGLLHTAEELPLTPAQSLSAVMTRIEEAESDRAPRGYTPSFLRRVGSWLEPLRGASPTLRLALAAQLAVIVLLVGLLARPAVERPEASYTSLGDPAAQQSDFGARLHVVFSPETSADRIREILVPVGAEIVAGPTPRGVYTLATPVSGPVEPSKQDLLEKLRAQPEIIFAEPIVFAELESR